MLFLICRKDTIFSRNFQGFWEKILERDEEKEKKDDSRIGGESPVECCSFDDETKDYLLKFPTLVYRAFLSP